MSKCVREMLSFWIMIMIMTVVFWKLAVAMERSSQEPPVTAQRGPVRHWTIQSFTPLP